MNKNPKKIKHVRPGPGTPPAKYEKGAKVLVGKYRVEIRGVWWSGEGWMYEVEGMPNGKHRGLWIHREEALTI